MLTLWKPRQVSVFDKMFDDFLQGADLNGYERRMFSPRINVRETQNKLIVEAELAGLDKTDVKVLFENGALKIMGDKEEETVEEDTRQYAKEIRYGSFERVIPIDENYIKPDTMAANFKNGILTIEVEKSVEKKTKEIEVKIT